jgi:hypothetical protein
MLAREARFADRAPVGPLGVLANVFEGGLAGYAAHVREPGWVDGMEQRYEAINAEAAEDAQLTAMEMASMLSLSEADGKLTANEQALLSELRKLEAEQAAN